MRYANLASLPFTATPFRSLGIKAHSSVHQNLAIPIRPNEIRSGARFEHEYHFGLPIFLEEEQGEMLWPGSFREVADHQAAGNSSLNFMEVNLEDSAPDLTLKL